VWLVVVLVVGLVGGVLVAQQPPTKSKGRTLPPLWSKLGLSEEQKQKAASIQNEFGPKIAALQQQITTLREQEKEEMGKILTDAQRARLKEILASRVPGGERTKDEDKGTGKDDKKNAGDKR
jgi:hypothetical protein